MRKILCVGYILVTFSSPSLATLLVYEGFGYPPFTDLDGAAGSIGEIGFDGPWIDEGSGGTLEDFGHYIDIDDSILGNVYSDIPENGFPNTPGFLVGERRDDNSAYRFLDAAVTATFQDGESTWFSYVSALTNDGSQPNNHHKPNFAIGNGELLDDRADNANGQAIGAGAHKAQNAGGLLSATYWEDEDLDDIFEEHRSHDKGDGSIARAGLEQQLIVGRIDWGESFDSVSMFAFDIIADDGYVPPTMDDFEDNAVSIETLDNLDQASFDMISVHGSRTHFDEIRIGTEFVDVVPGGVEEELCDPNTGGDLDGNGAVDFADFLVLSANFGVGVDGPSAHEMGDIDCNGTVEFADFLTLSSNFGATSETQSVPEPSAFSLFGINVLLLLCGGIRRARRL